MSPSGKKGRQAHSAAKEIAASQPWDKQASLAKYGTIAEHIAFLAAAANWVASAGADALIQHPAAIEEYKYRSRRLGQWVAAWLLIPKQHVVLAQVAKFAACGKENHWRLDEWFALGDTDEPIFGDVVTLRATGEATRLEIPVAIDMPPIHSVEWEIAWRSHFHLKADRHHLFSLSEISLWVPGTHRRTVERAVRKLGLPMRPSGRPKGGRDSTSARRQVVRN